MNQPALINLHPNEHNQELLYYQFRRVRSCNTLNDLSNKVWVPKQNRRCSTWLQE